MTPVVELLRHAKEAGDFSAVAAAIPYARWLGIGAVMVGGEPLGKLTFAPHLIGNPLLPALHGGTIGALLESTAIFQLLWQAETLILPKTINLTVEYLRSARPADTFARAVVTKLGRRVASVRAEAWQDDEGRPVASANAHFLIVAADPDEGAHREPDA